MEQLSQIQGTELVLPPFLQFQPIAGKVGEGTFAEKLKLGDTAT